MAIWRVLRGPEETRTLHGVELGPSKPGPQHIDGCDAKMQALSAAAFFDEPRSARIVQE